jgi:hypothetical protein
MLEKRKKFKKNQIVLKLKYLKYELKSIILKSLLKNHFNDFLFRLSFTLN